MEIINNTPWDTEALTALVTPFSVGDRPERITFINHQPQPGVKREDQRIIEVSVGYSEDAIRLRFELLTPKRAKTRTDALSRLSYAHDLEPHEVALLPAVIERIVHTLQVVKASKGYSYNTIQKIRQCAWGRCKCDIKVLSPPLIRGNTRVKTTPPVTLELLKRKLRWAEEEVEALETKLAKSMKKRDRLRERVEKKRLMNKGA